MSTTNDMPRIKASRTHATMTLRRIGDKCVVVSAMGGFVLTFPMGKDRDDVALWHQAAQVAERNGNDDLAGHISRAITKRGAR
jgi:hypothetical protein